ncbi:U-box domain-containing protein 44 [Ancistrocladus abbreviatus]
MAGSGSGASDSGSLSDESHQFERLRLEPIYDSFVCPLTKQVMRDPVTIETGQTFEREAIEKWFEGCNENGRRPTCPVTLKELRSTDLSPSIALRHTIEEWTARNEAAQLDMARTSLSMGTFEKDILQALSFVQLISQKSQSNKHVVCSAGMIHLIVIMLKNSSRRVRLRALETLRIVAEQDANTKEMMAEGDTVRTIVKFLSHERSREREEAVSLLYELSKSETLSEKIGSINGAILILVGMTSSNSENLVTAKKAEKTMDNLAKHENNVRQMAENGRLQPLLTLLLEGQPETKLSMAGFLGDLALNNDVKVHVAKTVGSSLIDLMRTGILPSREASLKALNQISSCEASAKVLIEAGILPPLVKDLFSTGFRQHPMHLKEVSATILSNVVNSGYDFSSCVIGPGNQTLVSENIIHDLLHLISNTGPAIECKLLQALVGLTSSHATVLKVVVAIKSSGATISLVQFIEAPQRDLRLAAIKLLHNLSPHMSQELADALRGTAGQLGSLIKIILENSGITEEQAAAVGFLADLPEKDLGLTRQMLNEGAFQLIMSRVKGIREGATKGNRFMTPYLEGLVRVLARVSYILAEEPKAVALCREHGVALLFTDLLQANGLENVQIVSAWALENLSLESKKLTRLPEVPPQSFCASIFSCFHKTPNIAGLCPVHGGLCSLRETFCLLDGQAVERLVALLDHTNEKAVEASLAALSTLLDDGVNIEQGVVVLTEAEGTRHIFDVLVANRNENLRRRAVWAVERLLRTEGIAIGVSDDANVGTALVDAFQHGDGRTRQIAERALKHVDKIPNFSGIFPNSDRA